MIEANPGTFGTPMAHEWAATREGVVKKTVLPSYNSLFDTVNYTDIRKSTDLYGSVIQVLTQLEYSLGNNTPDALATQVLHPARITRAVLNHKEQLTAREKDTKGTVEVVQAAAKLGLNTYRQSSEASQSLTTFADTATRIWGKGFLDIHIQQEFDEITWEATTPERSKNTAERLADRHMGNVLFIALGHGGVSAGMDVFLRYCERVGSSDSDFYPVRFSRLKMADTTPRLTQEELQHLRILAQDRSVVVFDEDASSGDTLNTAERFFETLVTGSPVVAETNLDRRWLKAQKT